MNSSLAGFIGCHRDVLVKTIIADELLDYLPSLKKEDLEAVESAQANGGKIKGARCLLDRVGRKASLVEFLQGLQRGGYEQLIARLASGDTKTLGSDDLRKFAAKYPTSCEGIKKNGAAAIEASSHLLGSRVISDSSIVVTEVIIHLTLTDFRSRAFFGIVIEEGKEMPPRLWMTALLVPVYFPIAFKICGLVVR